jgi:hypothetical protein
MHVVAGSNIVGGEADDLPVATHLVSLGHRFQGHFVPGRDHLRHAHVAIGRAQHGAGQEGLLGDGHRVTRIEQHRHLGQVYWPGRGTAHHHHAGAGLSCRLSHRCTSSSRGGRRLAMNIAMR